jgi:hypothetical protein
VYLTSFKWRLQQARHVPDYKTMPTPTTTPHHKQLTAALCWRASVQAADAVFEPGTLSNELLILATAANQLFQSTQHMSADAQVGASDLGVSSRYWRVQQQILFRCVATASLQSSMNAHMNLATALH